MKDQITSLIRQALAVIPAANLPSDATTPRSSLDRTRHRRIGDFASSLALRLAKAARRNPRRLARPLWLHCPPPISSPRRKSAGAGFINFHLAPVAYARELERIAAGGEHYGRSNLGAGTRVLVEFVSSDPTGPLHVGHGRHAAYRATLSNLLAVTGFSVHREYYVNDAGRRWISWRRVCGCVTWNCAGSISSFRAMVIAANTSCRLRSSPRCRAAPPASQGPGSVPRPAARRTAGDKTCTSTR